MNKLLVNEMLSKLYKIIESKLTILNKLIK